MNGNGGFVVTVIILAVALVIAAKLTESESARQPAAQPWVPWDRDYDMGMTPEDWDALETLLADEESLAEAEAAEQEARRS